MADTTVKIIDTNSLARNTYYTEFHTWNNNGQLKLKFFDNSQFDLYNKSLEL